MPSLNRKKLEELQIKLSRWVVVGDDFEEIKSVAGVDAAYCGRKAAGGGVVLEIEEGEVVEEATAEKEVRVRYMPGLFAFRELPVLIKVLKRLSHYDLVVVDGHGIAHPRSFGIASHLGLVLNKPTIGVAKRLLSGEVEGNRIKYKGREVGHVVGGKFYVSPGHRVSLQTARELVVRMAKNSYPRPLRLAHRLSRAKRQEILRR